LNAAVVARDEHLPATVAPQPQTAVTERSNKHVILFLAANPAGTSRLSLDEECAEIERELRMTAYRDAFDFRSKWAVSIDEMMRHMNELQPTIIHFSGHGGGSGSVYVQDTQRQRRSADRDVDEIAAPGIQLQGPLRQPQHVHARALTQMIGAAAPSARFVVLNACFSDAVADALCSVVDCVVGMRGAIDDEGARSFAVAFYRALGYRRSVSNAVAQAVATLAAKQLLGQHLPVCRTRDGVSADHLDLRPIADLRPLR
jgi:CHAT domain-containing protein